jgi:hypothetical protein
MACSIPCIGQVTNAAGRSGASGAERRRMLRLQGISEPELERHLLRRGVGELAAGRHACADCGRTPLVGEGYHRYGRGKVVCDLCRPQHADPPQASDVVRHPERGHAVRLRARSAA